MKHIALSFVLAFIATLACQGQGKYQISGKISDVADGATLLLVRNDGEAADTLATTTLRNGAFVLTGELDAPAAGGYLATADGMLHLPLIVEPANIMLNVTERGALIQGGEQQKLFARYNQIGQAYAATQAQLRAQAQQPGADVDALQAQIDEAYRNSLARTDELMRANPDAYATAYVIALGARNETEESLQAKYDGLGEAAKATVPGRQIAAYLERFAKLAVGQAASDFTVTRPNGDALTLYAVTAKYKLVVFWASWDAASRRANPEFIQLYQQFRPRSFEIVSVSLDDNRFAWDRAIEQDGISIWPNGSDLQGMASPVAEAYMLSGTLPYTVLIDDEGNIVAKGLLGDDLRKAVSDLTKKNRKDK